MSTVSAVFLSLGLVCSLLSLYWSWMAHRHRVLAAKLGWVADEMRRVRGEMIHAPNSPALERRWSALQVLSDELFQESERLREWP